LKTKKTGQVLLGLVSWARHLTHKDRACVLACKGGSRALAFKYFLKAEVICPDFSLKKIKHTTRCWNYPNFNYYSGQKTGVLGFFSIETQFLTHFKLETPRKDLKHLDKPTNIHK
jgi:hypothetical protein